MMSEEFRDCVESEEIEALYTEADVIWERCLVKLNEIDKKLEESEAEYSLYYEYEGWVDTLGHEDHLGGDKDD